jgi:prepilin-type N-terminal cleavage/methylation domain-containing protein
MPPTRLPIRPQLGFTLLEVIMSLSMLVIFFGIAGEVFKSTVLLSYDSQQLSNENSRIDSAIFQIRRDVWNGRQLGVQGTKSVELESSDGTKISWNIDAGGNLTRTDAQGHSERWEQVGKNWSLATDGICLMIRDGPAEVRLPSEILLCRRGQP